MSDSNHGLSPRRSLDAWKQLAEQRLGPKGLQTAPPTATAPAAAAAAATRLDADDATQTVFPKPTQDVASVTLVSTADLSRLFPVPDAATLMRASLPSLHRTRREVGDLLKIVQRDLAAQLHDAGITFDAPEADAAFAERQPLRFKRRGVPVITPTSAMDPKQKPYWEFATRYNDMTLYDDDTRQQARAMCAFQREVEERHNSFDTGTKTLLRELHETRKMLSAVSAAASQTLPARY